jgi:hypothetical protein
VSLQLHVRQKNANSHGENVGDLATLPRSPTPSATNLATFDTVRSSWEAR